MYIMLVTVGGERRAKAPVLACSTMPCPTISEQPQSTDKGKRQAGGVEDGMEVDSSRDCSGVTKKCIFFLC